MSLTVGDQTSGVRRAFLKAAVQVTWTLTLAALVLAVDPRAFCAKGAVFAHEQNGGTAATQHDDGQKKTDKNNNSSSKDSAAAAAKEVVYKPGGDVKSPKLVHYVEPNFSSSSKEAFVEGVVRISTVVKIDGVPSDIEVSKGLSSEEDQRALDAVGQWRFEPGTKNGEPVNVRMLVEVEFHLM